MRTSTRMAHLGPSSAHAVHSSAQGSKERERMSSPSSSNGAPPSPSPSRHSSSSWSISYAQYQRRSTHNRNMSSVSSAGSTGLQPHQTGAAAGMMGIYGSSPLATGTTTTTNSSSSSGGGGAAGLPPASSAMLFAASLFSDSGPSSRSMSPMPSSSSSSTGSTPVLISSQPPVLTLPSLIVGKRHRASPSLDSPGLGPALATPSATSASKQRAPGPLSTNAADGRAPQAAPTNFQPKGLAISRTAEFMAERKRRQEGGRLEDGRLGRRLEKLLAIHHNPVPAADKASKSFAGSTNDANGDYDSGEEPLLAFASSTASTLRKASSELWATLRAASSQPSGKPFLSLEAARTRAAEDAARRQAEQSIVKWQEDAEARKCPICASPFSLAVRKHHCRLCGRVVCASPNLTKPIFPNIPAPPPSTTNAGDGPDAAAATAAMNAAALSAVDPIKAAALLAEQKCSGLVVLTDARTGKVDDARKVAAEAAVAAASAGGAASEVALKTIESNVEERAIRICKDCRGVIFRQQYMLESGPVPIWLKLYEALMRLQREIEESLPEFHEMVLGLQKHDASTTLGSSTRTTLKLQRDAAQARKQLLANFAAYDALAKRIRNLPTPASISRAAAVKMGQQGAGQSQIRGGGGRVSELMLDDPQERVQLAIWTNANLFLQKNMFPLQTLPKPESKRPANGHARTSSTASSTTATTTAPPPPTTTITSLSEDAAAAAQIQEQIVVLREQQHLLEEYLARANAARRFEDAKMLRASWEEIEREVGGLLLKGAPGAAERVGQQSSVISDPRRPAGTRR
ncbi:hypothetical protein V8E36_004921 [Tilletia maclaganii]